MFEGRLRSISCKIFLVAALFSAATAFGLGHDAYIAFKSSPKTAFPLVANKHAAAIYLDPGDYAGVRHAVDNLQKDIERVSSLTPALTTQPEGGSPLVLVGTIGKSDLIDRLIREKKLDVSAIQKQRESFVLQVLHKPLPGVGEALVIAGSDKRGTIYGIYDLSEQIGVSPWYWWADVPVAHHDELYMTRARYSEGSPAVRYRGIFLNDEAPALTGWVKENYGTYNQKFYTKVFELLLRMKANYLWPAMWDNAFNEDDPENPRLAEEYGIVMGTSHHEPMLRAQQEWKRHGTGDWNYLTNGEVLRNFWTKGVERNKAYESTITVGMRGDGDMAMSETANVSLLEQIVADQRKIIAAHRDPSRPADLQVWALYKEVQEYYEKGMRVPDDVTLLWCDDNWGNIRRLPTPEERKRSGGAGIYYHFDYVGGPRSYKWINTNPLPKTLEQMTQAYRYGANQIWVVNVGDLKPMEFPIEFFLTLARDPSRWKPSDLHGYTVAWATREFGAEHAEEIASIVERYTKYNGRRKPELLSPDTFSQTNYREAERVAAGYRKVAEQAEKLYASLPQEKRDAFFELVLHPVKASAIVTDLYVTTGKNHLYAEQGRASTNDLAARARQLFQQDADLSTQYNHQLAGGKWNHMMDQTHIGYRAWFDPKTNVIPQVKEITLPDSAQMGVAIEGPSSGKLPLFDSANKQEFYIDVYNRGTKPFAFSATASALWIHLSATNGTIEKEQRLFVSIDWKAAPAGKSTGKVEIKQTEGASETVEVSALRLTGKETGYIVTNGYISIDAEHGRQAGNTKQAHWELLPDYGNTLSAITIAPGDAPSATPEGDSLRLEYPIYLLEKEEIKVDAVLAPTLNYVPGRGVRLAISLDNQKPQIVDALADTGLKTWEKAVSDNVRHAIANLAVQSPGAHTLKVWMVDPGVVIEKLVLDCGGLQPSYLGPPETAHLHSAK